MRDKPFYKGAREALKFNEEKQIFTPNTPCRNQAEQPCVRRLKDGREQFRTKECLPHHCGRWLTDTYPPDEIPHEWALDEDGMMIEEELGEYHGGPRCVRCNMAYCRYCHPDVLTEECPNQDDKLF